MHTGGKSCGDNSVKSERGNKKIRSSCVSKVKLGWPILSYERKYDRVNTKA